LHISSTNQPMIKHTVSALRSASGLRVRGQIWQRPLSVALLTLGLVSSACLSDVEVSECARQGLCGHSGASGSGSVPSADAGSGGEVKPGAAGDGGESDAGAAGRETGTAGGGSGTAGGGSGTAGGGSGTAGGAADGGGGGIAGGAADGGGGGIAGGGAAGSGGGIGGGSDGEKFVILPNTLRRPCANQPYEASLTVSNGTAPYRWQVASADWTVAVAPTSTDHATLSTAHIGSGTTNLTVQVTDADGAGKTANFSLIARDACWFAYTTVDGASGPKLKLLDPLTEPPTPHPFAHNDGVYDFQFSPNGQFLAYSFGRDATHPTGRHLALITLATLHEQVVDVLEDSLVAYSWSPDSKMIAVGFIKDE